MLCCGCITICSLLVECKNCETDSKWLRWFHIFFFLYEICNFLEYQVPCIPLTTTIKVLHWEIGWCANNNNNFTRFIRCAWWKCKGSVGCVLNSSACGRKCTTTTNHIVLLLLRSNKKCPNLGCPSLDAHVLMENLT
jgi:hypothetical protein